jgi:hypothetical protein
LQLLENWKGSSCPPLWLKILGELLLADHHAPVPPLQAPYTSTRCPLQPHVPIATLKRSSSSSSSSSRPLGGWAACCLAGDEHQPTLVADRK